MEVLAHEVLGEETAARLFLRVGEVQHLGPTPAEIDPSLLRQGVAQGRSLPPVLAVTRQAVAEDQGRSSRGDGTLVVHGASVPGGRGRVAEGIVEEEVEVSEQRRLGREDAELVVAPHGHRVGVHEGGALEDRDHLDEEASPFLALVGEGGTARSRRCPGGEGTEIGGVDEGEVCLGLEGFQVVLPAGEVGADLVDDGGVGRLDVDGILVKGRQAVPVPLDVVDGLGEASELLALAIAQA